MRENELVEVHLVHRTTKRLRDTEFQVYGELKVENVVEDKVTVNLFNVLIEN